MPSEDFKKEIKRNKVVWERVDLYKRLKEIELKINAEIIDLCAAYKVMLDFEKQFPEVAKKYFNTKYEKGGG